MVVTIAEVAIKQSITLDIKKAAFAAFFCAYNLCSGRGARSPDLMIMNHAL
jgi:hypothetical protein